MGPATRKRVAGRDRCASTGVRGGVRGATPCIRTRLAFVSRP
jgi:hypothetical protein